KVAGVDEVVMVTPVKADGPNPVVLAAAHLCGVDRVFGVGGAQAIAALAYGTETIARVDKIVGPGNVYVATAKRLVLGQVSIDSIAGPSEILVIADGTVAPDWIAADLLSQAEHDELAMPILVATDERYVERVLAEVDRQVGSLRNAEIARRSIAERARCFVVRDLDEAAEVSNRLAPEHLELAVGDPEALLDKIRNAGAIFLGAYTPEAIGDYVAGPNHVLPTGGTARFFSPLGVDDFVKKSSVIGFDAAALARLADVTVTLARAEGLDGHAAAVLRRVEKE
ncbi:MAG: histidinol dehydrogenase, partial [Myxococcales bacterium]|nr:histidinol dehydrogenase [Myxococcales bacterium]